MNSESMTMNGAAGSDRRMHRRADLEQQSLQVERWEGGKKAGSVIGQIVDLSAGGVRIRTNAANIRPENQIRVRLELPNYAGISPFVQTKGDQLMPTREWVGWMTVSRVKQGSDGKFEVAGRLVDMDEMDRGMLGLYLSTQPMAA